MNALLHREDDLDWLCPSRRILFPTDFGQAAQKAWSYALALAQALAAEILVLHVVQLVPADVEGCAGTLGIQTVEESLGQAAEGPLERMRAEAAAAGVTLRTDIVRGRIRREIVRAARDARATLILMGTSGRDGLRRTFLGSVAEWVVGHAPCPVWTVGYATQPMAASTQGEAEPARDRLLFQRSASA